MYTIWFQIIALKLFKDKIFQFFKNILYQNTYTYNEKGGIFSESEGIPEAIGRRTASAGGLQFFGHGTDVGHHHLVHKRAKAKPELLGDLLHLIGQGGPQGRQRVFVVLHALRQVHEVVQVNGVVFGLPVGHLQWPAFACNTGDALTKRLLFFEGLYFQENFILKIIIFIYF